MIPAIRFICQTYTSNRDNNGNCYHFAIIRSTVTGKALAFEADCESHAASLVGKVFGLFCFPEVIQSETVVPKKRWQAMKKAQEADNYLSDAELVEKLSKLEV